MRHVMVQTLDLRGGCGWRWWEMGSSPRRLSWWVISTVLMVGLGAEVTLPVGAQEQPAPEPTKTRDEATPEQKAEEALRAGHSIHGEVFNAGPRRAARLMEGQGTVEFDRDTPADAAHPKIKAFINQGVAQLHTFFYLEAERSFRQAAKLDPDRAIAYWGMAMANIENPDRARGFLEQARRPERWNKASKREQMHIDAFAARMDKDLANNPKEAHRRWIKGLEAIVEAYPDDLDALSWIALAVWRGESSDGVGSRHAVDRLLEEVLEARPDHPGALHYRIHLWDEAKPERALSAAPRYGPAAPGIAHAWHMPGHIYSKLHRYDDATFQQEASARVDHAYMIRDRVMPFEIHNYAHNNEWLAKNLLFQGRTREAIAVARDLFDQPRDPELNHPGKAYCARNLGQTRWLQALSWFGLWDQFRAADAQGLFEWSDTPEDRLKRLSHRGRAAAALGDATELDRQIDEVKSELIRTLDEELAKARREKEAAEAEAQGVDKPPPSAPEVRAEGLKPIPRASLEGLLAELEGWRWLARGDRAAALARFEAASEMRSVEKARALAACGAVERAIETIGHTVATSPNEVVPLAAQVELLADAGRIDEAKQACAALLALARRADEDWPALIRIRRMAQTWGVEVGPTPSGPYPPERFDLNQLGPLTWQPFPAEEIALPDTEGVTWRLSDHRGRFLVLLFYLGMDCAHCMEQLRLFGQHHEALRELGADVVGISTDDTARTRALKHNKDGVAFPMTLLADPELKTFRALTAYDDFEDQPLHAIVLVDPHGAVRYLKVSADPFLDVAFVKRELERLARLERVRNADRAASATPPAALGQLASCGK